MLDHYYTPRDLPLGPQDRLLNTIPLDHLDPDAAMLATDIDAAKPRPAPSGAVVDLGALEHFLAFDCDSDSESGSDDGYVSTLLRIQRAPVPVPGTARKVAGARRVARAVSMPQPVRAATTGSMPHVGRTMDVDAVHGLDFDWGARASPTETVTATNAQAGRSAPEGELFQSITAIPGLESTSFEELRLETYLQSLIATGTARPPPASARALVIPPAFVAPLIDVEGDSPDSGPDVGGAGGGDGDVDGDVEMTDADALPDVGVVHPQAEAEAGVQQERTTRDPRLQSRDPRVRPGAKGMGTGTGVEAPMGIARAASYPPVQSQQWG